MTPTACDPVKGQRVTWVAPSGCLGGAQKPKDFWEPCPGATRLLKIGSKCSEVLSIVALVAIAGYAGCIVCCLSGYVFLLRRRYAKYMTLDEPSSVEPTNIGAAV